MRYALSGTDEMTRVRRRSRRVQPPIRVVPGAVFTVQGDAFAILVVGLDSSNVLLDHFNLLQAILACYSPRTAHRVLCARLLAFMSALVPSPPPSDLHLVLRDVLQCNKIASIPRFVCLQHMPTSSLYNQRRRLRTHPRTDRTQVLFAHAVQQQI